MAEYGEHKKESGDETVYSVISGISGASNPPTGPLFLSSDEEFKPLRNPVDSGFPPTKQTFAIAPDDPIVTIWNSSLGDQVIKLIKPNPDWRALDVIRRGYGLRAEDNPVVIRITVMKGASVPGWQQLIYQIKICCIRQQCPNVLVQAREGKVFRGIFIQRPYDQRPFIGGSVGVVEGDHSETLEGNHSKTLEGDHSGTLEGNHSKTLEGGHSGTLEGDHSGTLGGYFELRQEGQQPMRVGVTCHHVVVGGSANLSCISPNSNRIIGICSPSATDYEENENDATSDLKWHKDQVQDIKNRASEGLASNAELYLLPNKEALITAEKASLEASGSFNTHLGHVFASSGFRRKQEEPAEKGCSLDWALIKVDQGRLGNNRLPEGVFSQFSCPNPPYITQTIAMDIGDRAVKWGRSTKSTAGTFSSIQSHVNLPDSDGPSTEWCFVGRDGREFGNRGDSGAFVLSRDGDLGGIIIGGSDDGPGGFVLTYVTPIAEVLNDIENQLGCSVDLPEV
ncbi:MAG: hypothetical protein M1840_007862 [Geoglossum simile]|nr:MAG: hypothetical protein M1840_007862 [Geoglossum simile]